MPWSEQVLEPDEFNRRRSGLMVFKLNSDVVLNSTFSVKIFYQGCLLPVKNTVVFILTDPGIIVPAIEINTVNEFNGLKKIFKVLFRKIWCGVWFNMDVSPAAMVTILHMIDTEETKTISVQHGFTGDIFHGFYKVLKITFKPSFFIYL